jgi:hypothetical protein
MNTLRPPAERPSTSLISSSEEARGPIFISIFGHARFAYAGGAGLPPALGQHCSQAQPLEELAAKKQIVGGREPRRFEFMLYARFTDSRGGVERGIRLRWTPDVSINRGALTSQPQFTHDRAETNMTNTVVYTAFLKSLCHS